jgi:hypothetical protein
MHSYGNSTTGALTHANTARPVQRSCSGKEGHAEKQKTQDARVYRGGGGREGGKHNDKEQGQGGSGRHTPQRAMRLTA